MKSTVAERRGTAWCADLGVAGGSRKESIGELSSAPITDVWLYACYGSETVEFKE